jgi:hypothetical protein
MRITRDLLHKFARETVKQHKRKEPDIHAAYLMGSLLDEEPLLGGTTDIDLMLVHKYLAPIERETAALTPEISVDVYHKTVDDYEPSRQFRQDAWVGYPLTYNHILLYDTDHWLEFLQASVSAEFHRVDNVLARVTALLASAREGWRGLSQLSEVNHLDWLDQFLTTLFLGANAITGLIGPPLATRRLMITFYQRLHDLGTPEVWDSFCGLLGCSDDLFLNYKPWISAFEQDLLQLAEIGSPPPHLAPCRQLYYLQGIRSLTASEEGLLPLWPLLRVWLDVHLALPQPGPGQDTWHEFLAALNLTDDFTSAKTKTLDAYLDHIEVLIENWADTYGF